MSVAGTQASPSPKSSRSRQSSPETSPRGKHIDHLRDGAYLVRIPAAKKTGDELKDEELQASYDCLASMVHSLISNPRHVAPLNSQLQKRLLTESQQVAQEEDSKFMLSGGADMTLRAIPIDWGILYITKISDLSSSDVTNANGVDGGSWLQLLSFETQLAPTQKFPPSCVIKDVMKRTLDMLSQHHGNRLANWKSAGGILPGGGINWKKGSWHLRATTLREPCLQAKNF